MPEASIQQNIFGTGNFVVGQGTLNIIQQLPELDREGHRNLVILRDKVQQFWIGGVLEKSVHGEALIALGRQSVAEAVDHPWASTLELPDQKSQLLSFGKKTSEIFYECGRALLILGEPGSGKTITLLELARDLIQKSGIDPTQPVPVIFNLSSWSARQPPLFAWLVEELKAKYFVSRKLAELWLQQNRLLLLLDGLDEVVAEVRSACVEAIHKHIEEQGSSGIVVCCRIRDYTALPLKLKLNAAICVQPLTSIQIDQYLQHSGASLAALRRAVNDDSVLRELARTPLMLSIMGLAYQNVTPEQMMEGGLSSFEKRREHIFEQYVQKMLLRRGQTDRAYDGETTIRWLAGLARQMAQRAQTMFLVEGLQPDWLPRRMERSTYFFLSRGLSSMLVISALAGAAATTDAWSYFGGVLASLFVLIVIGLSVGTVEALLFLRWQTCKRSLGKEIARRFAIYAGVCVAALIIVSSVADHPFWKGLVDLSFWVVAFTCAFFFGCLFGVVFGSRANRQSRILDIQTVESLAWSWQRSARGILRGFILGCLIFVPLVFGYSLILGFIGQAIADGLDPGFAHPLWDHFSDAASTLWHVMQQSPIGGAIGSVLGFLFGGLVRGMAAPKTGGNQGIRLSLRNALGAGVPVGLVLGVLAWSGCYLFARREIFLQYVNQNLVSSGAWVLPAGGITTGMFLGFFFALWYGGFDIIQHYTLRLLLWQRGYAPRRLVRFLDHASDLVFLQKVGGGYIFIHRLLLEHFAAMESKWSEQPRVPKPRT